MSATDRRKKCWVAAQPLHVARVGFTSLTIFMISCAPTPSQQAPSHQETVADIPRHAQEDVSIADIRLSTRTWLTAETSRRMAGGGERDSLAVSETVTRAECVTGMTTMMPQSASQEEIRKSCEAFVP